MIDLIPPELTDDDSTNQAMIRKEKTHLSRFAARAKELEAQGNETEALLSGIKEDKVGSKLGM